MLVPPIQRDAPERSLTSRDRRTLKQSADQTVLPILAELKGKQVWVEAPDQGSWFAGRLRSARRLQLCIEIVLDDVKIGGRLRMVEAFTDVVTVIRPIGSVIVLEEAPVLTGIGAAGVQGKRRRWWPFLTRG